MSHRSRREKCKTMSSGCCLSYRNPAHPHRCFRLFGLIRSCLRFKRGVEVCWEVAEVANLPPLMGIVKARVVLRKTGTTKLTEKWERCHVLRRSPISESNVCVSLHLWGTKCKSDVINRGCERHCWFHLASELLSNWQHFIISLRICQTIILKWLFLLQKLNRCVRIPRMTLPSNMTFVDPVLSAEQPSLFPLCLQG